MLQNYLKIAFRNLRKHKTYAFINVIGLAIGMTCCFLLFLFVWNEWSYDRFHDNADRLYRLGLELGQTDGSIEYQNMTYPEFRDELVAEFPTIEKATRLVQAEVDFRAGMDFFRYDLAEVDAPFFEMFTFPMIAGDPATALNAKNSIVVSDELAAAFFDLGPGRYDEALGKTVSAVAGEAEYVFTVAGVVERFPENSSIDFDAAISFENYDPIRLGGNNWGGRASTYILLPEGQTAKVMEAALDSWVTVKFERYFQALRDNEMLAAGEDAHRVFLQPLPLMHRQPDVWVPYEKAPFDPQYGFILGGIAVLVLLIACINFMTLSIGRSASRTREVGMRKALGAVRLQLMKQFWGEALLMTTIALAAGILTARLTLPLFNTLTGQTLSFSMISWSGLGASLLAVLVVVGLVAGGYPALVLSRFQPATVLRGQSQQSGKQGLTRALVVLQYTISIGLMVGTIIMAKQLSYLIDKDLGFDDELVMVIHARQLSREDAPVVLNRMKEQLLPYGEVTHVARTGTSFNRGSDRNTWTDENGVTRSAYNFGIGYDYIDLMGMELVEGRNFSPEFPSDSTNSILVNEALVRQFGLEDPVGRTLTGWLSSVYEESPVIIGVVKDFNFQSLRNEIEPAVMNMHPNYYNYMGAILVKMKPDHLQGTIKRVEQAWANAIPGRPFTYSFLDEDLAISYTNEQRWTDIISWSSMLAILIACLGLFGLATLSIVRRTKEIGIRKVLGASVTGVVELVTREFLILIGVAAIIAIPVAWWSMKKWLDGFAYRIDMDYTAFVLAPVAAVLIALLAIGYHAIKAATADPVTALRYE